MLITSSSLKSNTEAQEVEEVVEQVPSPGSLRAGTGWRKDANIEWPVGFSRALPNRIDSEVLLMDPGTNCCKARIHYPHPIPANQDTVTTIIIIIMIVHTYWSSHLNLTWSCKVGIMYPLKKRTQAQGSHVAWSNQQSWEVADEPVWCLTPTPSFLLTLPREVMHGDIENIYPSVQHSTGHQPIREATRYKQPWWLSGVMTVTWGDI